MSKQRIAIIPTKVANIASIRAALSRAGFDSQLVHDPEFIYKTPHVVLPGVGAFQPGMEELQNLGLTQSVKSRINEGKKILSICLGMQLLFSSSEEGPGIHGLGVFEPSVTKFPISVRVPQFGWNKVHASSKCKLLESGYAYFANSFRIETAPSDTAVATANYGGDFIAALEKDGLLACQFHPELSGYWGQQLIERWLAL